MSDKKPFSAWNIQLKESNLSNPAPDAYKSSFPIRSFTDFGGGDAPLMPRKRSQLFTISTRSVMASHSELNVTSYTTTTSSADLEGGGSSSTLLDLEARSSTDFNLNLDNDDDVTEKALNVPRPLKITKVKLEKDPIQESRWELESLGAVGGSGSSFLDSPPKSIATSDSEQPPPVIKRCLHGSLENLRESCDGAENITGGASSNNNRRKSAPPVLPSSNARCQMMAAANDLLHEENKCLTTRIQKTRKKLFITKIATCFALEALKRRGRIIKGMEYAIERKNEQCAARLILHSLLLNCWRNTRRELDMKMDDNNELRKSVENFTLQVQVLRHVSNNERQKAQEKGRLIESLNDEVKILREENRLMRREVEKMENELNTLQASTQNLTDENNMLTKEIRGIVERRDELNQCFERERRRSEEFGRENATMKDSVRKKFT